MTTFNRYFLYGRGARKFGARVIALVLLAGGLLGLLGSAVSVYHSFQQHQLVAGVSGMIRLASCSASTLPPPSSFCI